MDGVNGVIIQWGHCSRIHKTHARSEDARQFPVWLGNLGSNIQERFTT
jgi:hypothetical protein